MVPLPLFETSSENFCFSRLFDIAIKPIPPKNVARSGTGGSNTIDMGNKSDVAGADDGAQDENTTMLLAPTSNDGADIHFQLPDKMAKKQKKGIEEAFLPEVRCSLCDRTRFSRRHRLKSMRFTALKHHFYWALKSLLGKCAFCHARKTSPRR
jgi:hypothetical protein